MADKNLSVGQTLTPLEKTIEETNDLNTFLNKVKDELSVKIVDVPPQDVASVKLCDDVNRENFVPACPKGPRLRQPAPVDEDENDLTEVNTVEQQKSFEVKENKVVEGKPNRPRTNTPAPSFDDWDEKEEREKFLAQSTIILKPLVKFLTLPSNKIEEVEVKKQEFLIDNLNTKYVSVGCKTEAAGRKTTLDTWLYDFSRFLWGVFKGKIKEEYRIVNFGRTHKIWLFNTNGVDESPLFYLEVIKHGCYENDKISIGISVGRLSGAVSYFKPLAEKYDKEGNHKFDFDSLLKNIKDYDLLKKEVPYNLKDLSAD